MRLAGTKVGGLIAAGAQYIVVAGVYDMGKSPWAIAQTQESLFTSAPTASSTMPSRPMYPIQRTCCLWDAAFLVNRNALAATRGSYGFVQVTTPICTTPDALTCTSGTLVSGPRHRSTCLPTRST